MQLQNFYAQDVNGNIVPGAVCTLYLAGTMTLATGLQGADGLALSNPFTANGNGLASVAAPQGVYDLKMVSGFITSTIKIQFIDVEQVVEDAANAAAAADSAQSSATSAAESAAAAAESAIGLQEFKDDLKSSGPDLVSPSVVGGTGTGTGAIPLTLKQVLDNRNAYPFQFKAPGDVDDTASIIKALATGKVVDGLGLDYIISSPITVPSNRLFIRAKMFKSNSSADHENMIITGSVSTPSDNIHMMEIFLNGNREGQTNIGFGLSGDGDRSGFMIYGQATNIRLTRCKGYNCATDGLALFGAPAGVTFAIKGITLDQCDFQRNRRHGVSMDTLQNLRAFGGNWINNGNDLPGAAGNPITSGWYGARVGDVSGPQYGNGCDIESYGADNVYGTHVEDVAFYGTNMYGNYSGGLKILTMIGGDYMGGPGYNNPLWKPMKNIRVFGGYFDVGTNGMPSGETSPIQVGAAGLLPANIIGMDGFFTSGVECSSSIAINNTSDFSIDANINTLNAGTFPYHAFIASSKGNLNLRTPQALAIYQETSVITTNQKLSSNTSPTVTISGGTISSQATTLITSSLQSGQLFRINVTATLTLAVGSNLQLTLAGGRTVMDANGSYFNATTAEVGSVFYRASAGYFLLKPDTINPLEIVLYVTVI